MTKKSISSGIITNEMEIYVFETSCCFDHLLSSIGTGASLMNEKMRQPSLMDMKIGHSRPFPHRNRRPMPLAFALKVSIRLEGLNFENSKCKLTNGKGRG